MKIQLIAVGTKMPDWVTTGFNEYQRRFPKDMPLELVEIPAGKRGKNADIARILHKDIGLGLAMAAAAGCAASFGARALALFAETLERGWGAEDDAVLLRTAAAKIAGRDPD